MEMDVLLSRTLEMLLKKEASSKDLGIIVVQKSGNDFSEEPAKVTGVQMNSLTAIGKASGVTFVFIKDNQEKWSNQGGYIAIPVRKVHFLTPGTPITVHSSDGKTIRGNVVSIDFTKDKAVISGGVEIVA